LVVVNSLYETTYGRERALRARSRSLADRGAQALSIAATFTTICVLWSMWSSDSLGQWIAMWRTAGNAWIGVLGFVVALYAGSFGLRRLASRSAARVGREGRVGAPRLPTASFHFGRQAIACAATTLAVYAMGHPRVYSRMPVELASAVEAVRSPQLSARDQRQMEQGYYEKLLANRHNTELWTLYNEKPPDWDDYVHMRPTHDFLLREYPPNEQVTFRGVPVTTNEWGMRDQSYERDKAPGSVRIALVGSSHVAGAGVRIEDTFATLLEEEVNEKGCGGRSGYEIWNFAVDGHTDPQHAVWFERRVLPFEPDVLFYVAHPRDGWRVVKAVVDAIAQGYEMPYAQLQAVVERAGIRDDMTVYEMKRRLDPFGSEIIAGAYQRIGELCRERGILPIWILLPRTSERLELGQVADQVAAAREAGFGVVSLLDVYNGHDATSLEVAKWDQHPNAAGHALIARRLYDALCTDGGGLTPQLANLVPR
jgi:hypothetical protein